MKVLVTGATGFTGSHVVPLLLQQGRAVRCFVRPASDTKALPAGRVETARGDLDRPDTLASALEGMDALVNLASLGTGHADGIIAAARKAGISRALFMSTTAIFTRLNAGSKAVRLRAEESIRNSGLKFTVLRPTMIYGGRRDRNLCRLIRYLHRWPVIPVLGKGRQQPVYVGDVAAAVAQALTESSTVGKFYNIPGATVLTLDQMIGTICRQMNRRVWKVRLPAAPIAACVGFAGRFIRRLPVSSEQILRLREDKCFDFSQASVDFGYRPRSFSTGIALELSELAL